MKTPIALSMLLRPFSLPHDERWVLPLALGALLCAAHRHCVAVRAE